MTEKPKAAGWGDLLEKTVELGLGAALLTKEHATKLIDDLVKRGAVRREEAGQLVSDMMEKGKVQKQKMESFVAEVAERVLARADVARRTKLEDLEQRIARLEDRINRGS
jgi:polyhydroxyalkanoate synthesis regulator phasin